MKKLIANIAAAALTFSGVLASSMVSYATTVEDVIEAARKNGIPETMIQQGLNEYYQNPEEYADNDYYLDNALYAIENYRELVIDKFEDFIGSEQPSQPPTESEESQQGNSSSDNSSEESTEAVMGGNEENVQPETGNSGGAITTNPLQNGSSGQSGKPDQEVSGVQTEKPTASTGNNNNSDNANNNSGSTNSNAGSSDRINQKDFINMTLEEKLAYVASLPEDERQAFMHSLSAEELKSIVKQLPVDDKAVIVDKFVEVGESMGVEVTVDEISDDNVSMIMKNEKGELIDIATVGVIVDDTGYDYRLIYSICGACIIAAAGGIWLVIRKCFAKDGAEK